MGILSRLFGPKNPVDSMNCEDLRMMEIQMTKRIDGLRYEIRQVDAEIAFVFDSARQVNHKAEEIGYAKRIKTLTHRKEMKLSAISQLEKELRALSNILILKDHEADLKSSGLWECIGGIDTDELENWLIKKNLDGQNRDSLITDITMLTSQAISSGRERDEELDGILETIRAVRDGIIEPHEAGTRVVEKQIVAE